MPGILARIIGVIASIEANEAIKILSGHRETVQCNLLVIDLWENQIRQVRLDKLRESADCRTCRHGEYPWLSGDAAVIRPFCAWDAKRCAAYAPRAAAFLGPLRKSWPRLAG